MIQSGFAVRMNSFVTVSPWGEPSAPGSSAAATAGVKPSSSKKYPKREPSPNAPYSPPEIDRTSAVPEASDWIVEVSSSMPAVSSATYSSSPKTSPS